MKARNLTKETINQVGVIDRGFPDFNVGDTIAISVIIKEGAKTREQLFQGDVLAKNSRGNSSTFTVRKMGANSISVERIFPYYSPIISSIKVVKRGDVRRAKLYYIRDRVGKAARIKEKVLTKEQKELKAKKTAAAKKAVAKKIVKKEEAPATKE